MVPWVLGFIGSMSLEALAIVYSNILRDHINQVRLLNRIHFYNNIIMYRILYPCCLTQVRRTLLGAIIISLKRAEIKRNRLIDERIPQSDFRRNWSISIGKKERNYKSL